MIYRKLPDIFSILTHLFISIYFFIFPEKSVNARRLRRAGVELDYGACSVRVTKYQEGKVHFVLLCPPEMKPLEPQSAQRFVCGLLFDAGRSTSCGGSDSMKTPIPTTTTPPMAPME